MAADPRPVYQLKVTLEWSKPPIWRRILLPSTTTLPRLHSILQAAMGWTDSHLHQFVVGQVRYGTPEPEFDPDILDERRVPMDRLLREKGDALVYEYDFGDGWRHLVEVERVLPPDQCMTHPRCIAGERACPPEDVGGVPGYERFLDVIRDLEDPDHAHYLAWVGDQFDPETFDVEEWTSPGFVDTA
jgi:hypothetical protein